MVEKKVVQNQKTDESGKVCDNFQEDDLPEHEVQVLFPESKVPSAQKLHVSEEKKDLANHGGDDQ